MRKRTINSIGRIVAVALLCLMFASVAGCTVVEDLSNSSDIYCLDEPDSAYYEVLAQTLPTYSVGRTPRVYPTLNQKNTVAAEAFDMQTLSAIEQGVADYWYPQYLATVIIALDRDKTDADICGWGDLYVVNEEVGIVGIFTNHFIFNAIAFGLEGKNYTLTGAANLLSGIRKNGFLRLNSNEPSIVICYDYLAAAMIKQGRNIEIVVPCEGTFSYDRGLLSNDELRFTGDIDTMLVSAGFRSVDGQYDATIYPAAAVYEPAVKVPDYDHFNIVCLEGDRVFRRDVLNTRMFTSADGREHQLFPLIYMIVLIIWAVSVLRRAMQSSVRKAVVFTGIILLGWMTTRLIKFQIIDETTLGLYLWYSYYLFQLVLPLVALWLAYTIDKPDDRPLPKWLLALSALNISLIVLVFTNHLHGLVFQIDFSKLNWATDYGYGIGYTIIQVISYSLLGIAFIIMLVKCGRNSRKKSRVFPLGFLVILVIYGYGYFAQIPIARESDITMVTGLLVLMIFESALSAGLIPVNSKYVAFFSNTSLGIQIIDSDDKTVFSSAAAVEYNPDVIAKALTSYPHPLPLDENTLLFGSTIRGGSVLWQEDISVLNRLHAEVDESVGKLSAANAMLIDEEKIKRTLTEENEKERLLAQLEAEIAAHTAKLSSMAQQLENVSDRQKTAAGIAILLCYVKRRCNLFFREQEVQTIPPGELTGYIDELAGIAAYSDIKIIVSSDISSDLTVRRSTLFYDFFYLVIEWAAMQSSPHVMVHFQERNGSVIMRVLPYISPKGFIPGTDILTAIASDSGIFALKNLDDAVAISLSFPQGGENDE